MPRTQKKEIAPKKLHVKKGDTVMVVTGKDKGKTGTIKQVFISKQKVLVEGLNIIKKATKPNPMMGQQGGIIQMEAPIPASRVMLYSHKASKPTRISKDVITDTTTGKTKRVRICKHTKEQLDD